MRSVRQVGTIIGAALALVPQIAAAKAGAIVDTLTSGATAIPEPGDLALFLLGVTGLIVGRRASRIRAVRKRSELDG
jgi:hypothetical protein